MNNKIRVAISQGDFNGIGLEVILKALAREALLNRIIPVIYGSSKVVSYHKNIVKEHDFQFQNLRTAHKLNPDRVNVVNCWQDNVNIALGKPTEESGRCAAIALDRAVRDLTEGLVDVLVTAPINKHAMQLADFQFPGHTEFLAKFWEGKPLMFMVSDNLKVAVATGHIPLRAVPDNITKDLIVERIELLNNSLHVDYGIEKPVIAVLGLNPHAGEQGSIGDEEEKVIRPAIIELKKNGLLVMGPFPADGFFGSGRFTRYDGILAMYHDQGLTPFKTLSFHEGINYTAGLNYVRTSPDHGTAYDMAGKNEADPTSMIRAIYEALLIYRNRKEYEKIKANAIKKEPKPSEEK